MGVGIMEVRLISARGLKRTDFFNKIDPYVMIRYRNEEHTSSTAEGQGSRPEWNEEFKYRVEYPAPPKGNIENNDNNNYKLHLQIYDRDTFTADDYLGHTTIYLKELFELGVEKGKAELGIQKYRVVLDDGTYHGEIKLGITFTHKGETTKRKYSVKEGNTNPISAAKRISK